MKGSPLERFNAKWVQEGECRRWTGGFQSSGYGLFWDGRSVVAHKWIYEQVRGPVPVGLVLDHLCRNRWCVNVDHLEAVANRVNILRGEGPSARAARKSSCAQGHEFTTENTYQFKGLRLCRACRRHEWRRKHGAGNWRVFP